jgi:hypothetical protein
MISLMFPEPSLSSHSIEVKVPLQAVALYSSIPVSVNPFADVSIVANPLAGATKVYHTSPPAYVPQVGAGTPAVAVDPTFVLAVVVQEVFTASAIAAQGSSFVGGGGAQTQMLKVPVAPLTPHMRM